MDSPKFAGFFAVESLSNAAELLTRPTFPIDAEVKSNGCVRLSLIPGTDQAVGFGSDDWDSTISR